MPAIKHQAGLGAAVPQLACMPVRPVLRQPPYQLHRDMREKLAILPPDIRELVESLPEEKAREVIAQLIQASELSYRPLSEEDIDTIKARTAESSQFGFLSADVDITWEEVSREGYVALGAFDDARNVPIAFIIAEVSRLDETREFLEQETASSSTQQPPQPSSLASQPAGTAGNMWGAAAQTSDSASPAQQSHASPDLPVEGHEVELSHNAHEGSPALQQPTSMRELLKAGGWSPSDVIVGVYYVGVDYEYRRQGIGKQLLDYVKDIAQAARARMMWLNVAEWNTNALAFYESYGFQQTDQFKKGQRGNHILFVYPLRQGGLGSGKQPKGKGAGGRKKGLRGRSTNGKGFGAAAQLRVQACAALHMNPPALAAGDAGRARGVHERLRMQAGVRNMPAAPSQTRCVLRQQAVRSGSAVGMRLS